MTTINNDFIAILDDMKIDEILGSASVLATYAQWRVQADSTRVELQNLRTRRESLVTEISQLAEVATRTAAVTKSG